jgi:iron(III) transport system ATP-binding protein
MSGLALKGITHTHPGATQPSLANVSFTVGTGTLTSLLGPSGCGKTTLLRIVAGLIAPAAGTVHLDGRDLAGRPPEARGVGMVFQAGALFPHLTVEDNVRFPLDVAGTAARQSRERAREALQAVGLADMARARVSALSGGEQQRAALARAIAQAPSVLLLDEPVSSIEPRMRRVLRDEIRTLQARLGLTAVYVTHDQQEALAVSDQIVLLEAGRVVQAGTPRALYDTPVNAFAAAFMGEGCILPGRREPDGSVWLGPLALPHRHPGAAGPVQVTVRPEAWRLVHCSLPGLPGSVARRSYLGATWEYTVQTAVGPVLAHAPARGAALEPGAPVALQLAPQGAWVA